MEPATEVVSAPSAAAPVPSAPSVLTPELAVGGGLGVVAALAVVKLALHLASAVVGARFGYGFFIDELYYLALSHHLAWGYVDMPPLFPALVALWRALVGDSLVAVRLLPALAGAALVLATGLFARDLGGRRFAQGMAALGVLAAPIWLGLHGIATMNALEQLLWTAAAWIVLRIVRDGWERGWLWFGVVCGIGLLNKQSMAFFGVAMLAGLLLTRERRALASRWLWLGGLAALAIALPSLAWDFLHGFPHLEMLRNIKASGRDVHLGPLQFLAQQALLLDPLALPLWLGGLLWLLADREGRRYRILGIAFVALIAEMLLLDGRVYYPAPAYPMLFAAGGVAFERLLERRLAPRSRRWAKPAAAIALAASGLALAPLTVPFLPPPALVRYLHAIGTSEPRLENHALGPLPQLMADRFGWPEMAAEVARIYRSLPPAERARAAIFGQNYGQAGAIDRFGPTLGLPPAISGHLTYFLWGPRGYTGEVMIVLDDRRDRLEHLFQSVELAGHVSHPYSMPYEHFDVWVCRGIRQPLSTLWPQLKSYD